MHKTKFGRIALAKFFVAGWVALLGGAIEYAQAQFVNPVPPPPPPVFNPSTPYTVPQPRQTPVSPGLPSSPPKSGTLSPSDGSPPTAVARSHRQVARAGGSGPLHRGRSLTRRSNGSAPDYRLPLDYSGPYCFWQRYWDGYWEPACFW